MKKLYLLLAIGVLLGSLIFPTVAMAAWWKPSTWKIFLKRPAPALISTSTPPKIISSQPTTTPSQPKTLNRTETKKNNAEKLEIPKPTNTEKKPPASEPTNLFNRDLTLGDSGQDVTALQTFLQNRGFLSTPPSGIFDSATREAVISFQESLGISVTGFVGAITRAAMNTSSSATSAGPDICPSGYTCSQPGSTPVTVPITAASTPSPVPLVPNPIDDCKPVIKDMTWKTVPSATGKVYDLSDLRIKILNEGSYECDTRFYANGIFVMYIDEAKQGNELLLGHYYLDGNVEKIPPTEFTLSSLRPNGYIKKILSGHRKLIVHASSRSRPPRQLIYETYITAPDATPFIEKIEPSTVSTKANTELSITGRGFSALENIHITGNGITKIYPNLNSGIAYTNSLKIYFGASGVGVPPGTYKIYLSDGIITSNQMDLIVSEN